MTFESLLEVKDDRNWNYYLESLYSFIDTVYEINLK